MQCNYSALQLRKSVNGSGLLLSVSGIGPRLAQGILSGIDVQELHDHIVQGEAAALTSIPGIGKKTAERLIVELRDKASKISFEGSAER